MRKKVIQRTLLVTGLAMASIALTIAGCSSAVPARPQAAVAAPEAEPGQPGAAGPAGAATESKPSSTSAAAPAETPAASARSGVQLWADRCARCHNPRPPNWRSKADREVSVHHMRIRVPMTGDDEREIIKFLTSQ
jgi:hypothetical protein